MKDPKPGKTHAPRRPRLSPCRYSSYKYRRDRTRQSNVNHTPFAVCVKVAGRASAGTIGDSRPGETAIQWPSLNRVMLLRTPNGWMIMTDSGIPIREKWNEHTFAQLVADLLSA